MIKVYVEGIGVCAPGLENWVAARPVLAGLVPYEPGAFAPPPVTLLPPAERRRAGNAIRLAIAAGTEAVAGSAHDPVQMAMVFTSSGGDVDTLHDILCVLATDRREVSPTRFHNSVHNAPAGYWAVATGSHAPSTSLCAYDASFSAGLLEAAVQARADAIPVTLAAYDLPYPEPLNSTRPIAGMFAMALALTPEPTGRAIASLTINPGCSGLVATKMTDARLERLRRGNPAARGLPLLAAMARREKATICLETGTEIRVQPA